MAVLLGDTTGDAPVQTVDGAAMKMDAPLRSTGHGPIPLWVLVVLLLAVATWYASNRA